MCPSFWFSLLLIIFMACAVAFGSGKEGYGPVKMIKRVPRTDCYNSCTADYNLCVNTSNYYNSGGVCGVNFQNCVRSCDYTGYKVVP